MLRPVQAPVLIADALINVRITGVRIKGMSIVRLKIIGNPNTAISLILNRAEGRATKDILRLWLCFEAMYSARTKLRAVPQPPINTKVSRKVFEKISVGMCPCQHKRLVDFHILFKKMP